MGLGMVPFKIALVSSYRPSITTFPLSLRVSEILPLLCSSTQLFPTPLLVSPKFSHLPWEQVDGLLATKSEGVALIVRAISFPRFPTYVIMSHERHGQTDRRTDERTDDMQSQYRALHYSASRGKKSSGLQFVLLLLLSIVTLLKKVKGRHLYTATYMNMTSSGLQCEVAH